MITNMETLGLKTSYCFKEAHIPTSHERYDIHKKLRELIAPTIRDLESRGLINGFHHIVHDFIDLRLSCDDWGRDEARIKEVLQSHSIPADLTGWGPMPADQYGGERGVLLCYNNLEFNSRLSLALIELINETDDEQTLQMQQNLCPHQWIHYLFNQIGILNLEQIEFEFNDAFVWLRSAVVRSGNNPQATSRAKGIIERFRKQATQFENDMLKG